MEAWRGDACSARNVVRPTLRTHGFAKNVVRLWQLPQPQRLPVLVLLHRPQGCRNNRRPSRVLMFQRRQAPGMPLAKARAWRSCSLF